MTGEQTKIAVIGGGPGGYVAAIRAARLGAKVSLIEKNDLGGTYLNSGAVPFRTMAHTAKLYRAALNGATCGVVADVRLNLSKVQSRKVFVVNRLIGNIHALMAENNIDIIKGEASFSSPSSLIIGSDGDVQKLNFDKAIIACGSVPVQPIISGIDSPCVIGSNEALELTKIPSSMIIIGGGAVGIEMAALFNAFGSKVTVIEQADEILPTMDREISGLLRRDLAKRGIEFLIAANVLSIAAKTNSAIVEIMAKGGAVKARAGEKILIACGRTSVARRLGLSMAGISNEDGWISTNNHMETSVPGIYAVGDCCKSTMKLGNIAARQGEAAAQHAMGQEAFFDANAAPIRISTDLEFASVGLSEEAAIADNMDIRISHFPLSNNAEALITNDGVGMIKLITGTHYGEVIGAHILAPNAGELIAEAAMLVSQEGLNDDIINTLYAQPTFSEAMREAALGIEGQSIHKRR